MTTDELDDLESFLQQEIPFIPEKVKTFFDIGGFASKEVIISNFYAYYFDPNESHGFGSLFLDVLIQLINERDKPFSNEFLESFSVFKEVLTEERNRIDLVIKDSRDNNPDRAIIIENKIYAELYNDLEDYYNHIEAKQSKVGIVLSLNKIPKSLLETGEIKFINILHYELLDAIEAQTGPYLVYADLLQIVILKQFIQNIKSMSNNIVSPEMYSFFTKNRDKIKQSYAVYNFVKEDIVKQTENVCYKLDMGLEIKKGRANEYKYFAKSNTNVYFTVYFGSNFESHGSILVIIELNADGYKHIGSLNKIEFTDQESSLINPDKFPTSKWHHHFAKLEIKPSVEDYKNFTMYVYNKIIHSGLKGIFEKIEHELSLIG